MKLRTTILATTAAAALAFGFSPQLLAQGANTQAGTGTSMSHSASGGQARGAGNSAASSTSGQANANGGGGHAQNGAGMKSEKTETTARIGSTSNTTVRERSRTRVGVYSGGREDVILHRRRPHGMVVYNDEPSSRVIVRHRRPHDFVMYNNEPRRRVVIQEKRPGIAVNERTVTRSRAGGEINVRAGERSREVTTGSASKTGPSQGSSASKQPSGSQVGGEARAPGGNAGKQPSTTGQANH
jgi:hypothetical protein